MRATTSLTAFALVALATSSRAESLMSFSAGYQVGSGNEPGTLAMEPVAYPFERDAVVVQFSGEIDGVATTDRGGKLGLLFDGGLRYATTFKRMTEAGEVEPDDAKFRFMIGGGTLLPILRSGAWRLDGQFSLEWYFMDQLAISSGVRARRIQRRSVQRVQYDIRPFWLGTNRLEHELTIGLGVGGVGVRAQALFGDERDRSGGYRYQAYTVGVEIVR